MSVVGIYPVYKTKFKIKTGASGELANIKDMESFSLTIDGNVEEFTPMDTDGWVRRLMTGKSFSVGLNGKRHVGDPGNDYINSVAWKDGLDCSSSAEVEFFDGATLTFDCVINVTNTGGGDSTNIAPLEFELLGDGKPVYTPAV